MRKRNEAFDKQVLDGMVLETLRSALDPTALLALEAHLTTSISRAIDESGRGDEVSRELVVDHLKRAWTRLTEEMFEELDERVLVTTGDDDCPICAAMEGTHGDA